ncbi:MAG: hypothetical protein SF052_23860 [Bacteroidia bacterium]|nr:hypothetical protein [Bacteroidia bacterium]
MYTDLSETARLNYDFWKQLQPNRISEQRFEYTTKVTDTYHWELTINGSGLYYKDVSGEYNPLRGAVSEQLLSDFWFYGPLLPIPDLYIRKQLVAIIRNAFIQAGSPASYKHFDLFEYPTLPISPLQWVFGDHHANDFIIVRDYGIEMGATNWHDGLVYLKYLSFENFLTIPPREDSLITQEIRAEIEALLARKATRKRAEDVLAPNDNAESKRLFMDNGGQIHYIHRDGFGDVYKATAKEEATWRAELIDHYKRRLLEEDNESTLLHITQGLAFNGVKNVGDLLFEAAKTANPKAKQTLAKILVEQFDAELGAKILISLLEYEAESDYWRNYVFNSFFNMHDSQTVQNFIAQKLRGDNEVHLKKSVDVLRMWELKGHKTLSDKNNQNR